MDREKQPLESVIIRDYTTIAKLANEQGREWWRKQVCLPIFAPIEAEYPLQEGYIESSNLALGCAFPVALSDISLGDKIVDLGCAAGVDSFIAAHRVGQNGFVYGFDLTPELIEIANSISMENSINNIAFQVADISNLPLENESCDAAFSNGVFSLLSNRKQVFSEIFRILKPGGHFLIADLTSKNSLPEDLHSKLMSITGCINGISSIQGYIEDAQAAGFEAIELRYERVVLVPESELKHNQWAEIMKGEGPLRAIGLFGRKS